MPKKHPSAKQENILSMWEVEEGTVRRSWAMIEISLFRITFLISSSKNKKTDWK